MLRLYQLFYKCCTGFLIFKLFSCLIQPYFILALSWLKLRKNLAFFNAYIEYFRLLAMPLRIWTIQEQINVDVFMFNAQYPWAAVAIGNQVELTIDYRASETQYQFKVENQERWAPQEVTIIIQGEIFLEVILWNI